MVRALPPVFSKDLWDMDSFVKGAPSSPPFRNNAIWHLKDSTCRYLSYAICRFTTIYSNDRQMAQQKKGGFDDLVVSISYENFGLSRL